MQPTSLGDCVAVVDPQSFLDNLESVRLAMSVALEHTQEYCDQFVKTGTGEQLRQAERSISKVRSLAEQLEKEFNILQDFIDKTRSSPGAPT